MQNTSHRSIRTGGSGCRVRDRRTAIYQRIAPLAFRLDDAEYPQLPPLIENVISVDLPSPARRIYDLLEADLFARVGDRLIVAENAAAASTKCRQVASGAVYLDPETDELGLQKLRRGGKEWAEVHGAKIDALIDLAEELQGAPLFIGYEFRHDAERIVAALAAAGFGNVPVLGELNAKSAAAAEKAWNAGELPCLLGHPASVGHGLNLQGSSCADVCWFSCTWDYELYEQFVGRVWRDGTHAKRVAVHHLVARDTVEEAQLWALRSKGRGQRALFDALGELAKRRVKNRK